MGIVYEVVQIWLGRRVALKVLPIAGALDARQLQRFKNEAQLAAQLHHQHIVPVYAVGCERGVHYYAMQFIDGQTVSALIGDLRRERDPETRRPGGKETGTVGQAAATQPANAATGPVTGPSALAVSLSAFFRAAANLALQAAEALELAHGLGVVHRDVKPANLLVDSRGHLWVTDFGLAQVQSDNRLTLTGDLLGTLRYMSPEQPLGRPAEVNQRTDRYSLGATLFELLTLEPPFNGRDRQELLRQIALEKPASAEAHFDLAAVLWTKGCGDEALEAFRKAVELKPTWAEAHAALGAALIARDRLDEAMFSILKAGAGGAGATAGAGAAAPTAPAAPGPAAAMDRAAGLYVDTGAAAAVLTSVISGNQADGGAGQGVGGGVHNLGTFSLDAASAVLGNQASSSNDDIFGPVTPL